MHSVTHGRTAEQTDRQQYDANSRLVGSAKGRNYEQYNNNSIQQVQHYMVQ